jgi:nucleoside-diphosphate-sugar epimerase
MAIDHANLEIVAACRDPSALLPAYQGEVRVGDLRDSHYLDHLLAGVDIICHCAGWTSFLMDEALSTEHYLEPTLDLINRALEWHIPRFVNLSNIAVTLTAVRNDAQQKGQPKAYSPMLNCLIAVEDYMQNQSQRSCSFINLRAGIYSGRRLNMGVLQLMLTNHPRYHLPTLRGDHGYLPLVDGQDLGQAFARAALLPIDTPYVSFNIVGPDCPSQQQVVSFIAELTGHNWPGTGVPAPLAYLYAYVMEILQRTTGRPGFNRCLLQLLRNPAISNTSASNRLGYEPKINWKSSLEWAWKDVSRYASEPILRQAIKSDYLE